MPYNLDNIPLFEKLSTCTPPSLKTSLTKERIRSFSIKNDQLTFSFASSFVDEHILATLSELADHQDVISRYAHLLKGEKVNQSEGRGVSHHHTRNLTEASFYTKELQRVFDFCDTLHSSKKGFSGKPFSHIVQIGIGGSKLGPESIHTALSAFCTMQHTTPFYTAHFIGNADPLALTQLCQTLPLDETLFIFVSKSGSTAETQANLNVLTDLLHQQGIPLNTFKPNLISITCPDTLFDNEELFSHTFYITPSIGGRFSTTSAVGTLINTACFGKEVIYSLLEGTHQMDRHAQTKNPRENACLMAALISVWEHTFLKFSAKAIIPYSDGLALFPAFLQQLICESNGKRVNRKGFPITYKTAPFVFGEPGTDCQHSFFQLLHQGTQDIHTQFIGFKSFPFSPLSSDQKDSISLLNSSLIAQITALSIGEENENQNKEFPGNKSSSLVICDTYSPYTIGSLVSFYENTVMFEGFLLNINSFDQEGVQLGKKLTQQTLSQENQNPLLTAFSELFE